MEGTVFSRADKIVCGFLTLLSGAAIAAVFMLQASISATGNELRNDLAADRALMVEQMEGIREELRADREARDRVLEAQNQAIMKLLGH